MVKCSFLLVMLFALFFQNSACAATHYSRTGQEIDKHEIQYFELFPNVNAVESVLLPSDTATGQDYLRILVRRAAYTTDTTLSLPRNTFQQLLYYINNFERIYAGQTTVDWETLKELVRAYSPLIPQQPITIKTAENKMISVFLFAVTDSALICYTGKDWTQWQTYDEANVLVLPFYHIESVQKRFIGKNLHLFALAQPFLKKHELFLALPPELRTLYNKKAAQFKTPVEALKIPTEMLQKLFPPRRFHISASAGVYTFTLAPHLYSLISGTNPFGENTHAPGVDNHAVYVLPSFDAAFSFFQRWSLAFSFASLPSVQISSTVLPPIDSLTRVPKGISKRYQKKFEGNSFALGCAYSFVKPNAFFDVPLEMQAVAGAILMDVSIHSLSRNLAKPYNLGTSTNNQLLILPYFGFKIDYFLSRTFSLHGKADFVTSGAIQDTILVPKTEQVKGQKTAGIPLTRTSVSLGLSLHL